MRSFAELILLSLVSSHAHFRLDFTNKEALITIGNHTQTPVKMNLTLSVLILSALCNLSNSCREEKIIDIFEPEYDFDNYGNERTITRAPITRRMTIVCSGIFSLSQISYNYQDHQYEQFLSVQNSRIPVVSPMELSKFSTIVKLVLSELGIKTVSPGAFRGLTALKELYLNNNKITKISHGVYNSLQHLQVLELQNNSIRGIEEVALTGLSSLTRLNLSNNNLTTLSDDFFQGLDKLRHVDFTGNPLGSFPFRELPEVDTLLLSQTVLTTMSDNLSNHRMSKFDLSFSQITTVDFKLFPRSNTTDLSNNNIMTVDNSQDLDTESLNLDNNQLETITGVLRVSKLNLGRNKFEIVKKELFGRPSSLLLLDFGHNKLSVFDNDLFHNCTSLETLVLRRNRIKKIDLVLFRDLTKLASLDLSGNLIEDFQFGVFDNLWSLQVLNISDNRLTTLGDKLHSLRSLRALYFDYNEISSFEASNFRRLAEVSLDHNPWKCQELIKLANVEVGPSNILRGRSFDVENFRGIACEDSSWLSTATKTPQSFDFDNSKFVKFFDGDFKRSGFFNFLSNFKVVVEKGTPNGSKAEKITFQGVPEGSDNILVFVSVVLTLILLVLLFYVGLNTLKMFERKRVSEMELC